MLRPLKTALGPDLLNSRILFEDVHVLQRALLINETLGVSEKKIR